MLAAKYWAISDRSFGMSAKSIMSDKCSAHSSSVVPCIWVCSGSEQCLDVLGIAIESRMMQRGSASIVLDVRVRALGQKVIKAIMPHIEGREMYWRRVCVTCSVQSRLLKLLRFRGRLRTVATKRSDVDSLNLVERDLLPQSVVELGGAGGLVPRDPGRDLEVAAVSKVLGDPGPAEAVGADLGW